MEIWLDMRVMGRIRFENVLKEFEDFGGMRGRGKMEEGELFNV